MAYTPQYLANDTAPIILDLTGNALVEAKGYSSLFNLFLLVAGVTLAITFIVRTARR